MHFVGMQALVVPGNGSGTRRERAAVLGGMGPGAGRHGSISALPRRRAMWAAPALLTLAICFMHFTAMGAVMPISTTAVVVRAGSTTPPWRSCTGGAMLIMLSAFGAAFINGMAQKQVGDELRRQRDDLQQGKEELRRRISW